MTRPREKETDQGIQGTEIVESYDQMQRTLRDRGWIETKSLMESGIDQGVVLEIGPGPGYLGLEWLTRTDKTMLKGLDISPDMIKVAEKNAKEYGLDQRTEYVLGRGDCLPFPDDTFDAVFTNGSLHEWDNPGGTFDEIWRVLKPKGRYHVSDLRRDMFFPVRWFLWIMTKPRSLRPGLVTSINAAYTPSELEQMAASTCLGKGNVKSSPIGITLTGAKM